MQEYRHPAEDVEMREIVEAHGFSLHPESELMKYCVRRKEEAERNFPAQLEKFMREEGLIGDKK